MPYKFNVTRLVQTRLHNYCKIVLSFGLILLPVDVLSTLRTPNDRKCSCNCCTSVNEDVDTMCARHGRPQKFLYGGGGSSPKTSPKEKKGSPWTPHEEKKALVRRKKDPYTKKTFFFWGGGGLPPLRAPAAMTLVNSYTM